MGTSGFLSAAVGDIGRWFGLRTDVSSTLAARQHAIGVMRSASSSSLIKAARKSGRRRSSVQQCRGAKLERIHDKGAIARRPSGDRWQRLWVGNDHALAAMLHMAF
jgi:hypothetical protein